MKALQFLMFVCCIGWLSCASDKTYYNGENISNYPDLELIWKENIEQFDRGPETYKLITLQKGKRDSCFTHPNQINWNEWKDPFVVANIKKSKFDKHYKIDMFNDTLAGTLTILYTALTTNDPTRSISIVSDNTYHAIQSVFIEYNNPGFFSSTAYKVLFVNNESLQIQETSKKPFSAVVKRIRILYFH